MLWLLVLAFLTGKFYAKTTNVAGAIGNKCDVNVTCFATLYGKIVLTFNVSINLRGVYCLCYASTR